MTDNQVTGVAFGSLGGLALIVLGWVKGWLPALFRKMQTDSARVHESDNNYNLNAAKMFGDRLVAVEQELRLSKIGFEEELAQAKVREDACEAKYTALAQDNAAKSVQIAQLQAQNASQAQQINELWTKVGEIEKPTT